MRSVTCDAPVPVPSGTFADSVRSSLSATVIVTASQYGVEHGTESSSDATTRIRGAYESVTDPVQLKVGEEAETVPLSGVAAVAVAVMVSAAARPQASRVRRVMRTETAPGRGTCARRR